MRWSALVVVMSIWLALSLSATAQTAPAEVTLIGLFAVPDDASAARLASERINSDQSILPQTTIKLVPYFTERNERIGVHALLDAVNNSSSSASPKIGIIGASSSRVCTSVSYAASWYHLPELSNSCTAPSLSNRENHPFFMRGVPPDNAQGEALVSIIKYFGWEQVATISSIDEYGVGGLSAFTDAAREQELEIVLVEQFISGSMDLTEQVRGLKDSGSRVFLSFTLGEDHRFIIKEAEKQGIVGEFYVWFCSDGCSEPTTWRGENGTTDQVSYEAAFGTIGTLPAGGRGPSFEELLAVWRELDPEEYPGAGTEYMLTYAATAYDVVHAYAYALDALFRDQQELNGETLLEYLYTRVNFTGVTGHFQFNSVGDRIPEYDVVNLAAGDSNFQRIGFWAEEGLTIDDESIYWPGGSNVKPDLDVRPPLDYWSCHDRREYTDPTGKEVKLERPDSDDANNIDIDYRCDEYLDCHNMSDEWGCNPSILPGMIVLGTVTGLLILLFLLLAVVVIVIAIFFDLKRVQSSGTLFLLTLTSAAILGLISTYSFYGKPHKVSCGFQPWLLGPAIMLLISTLFVRAVTQFLSLRSQYKVLKFSVVRFLFSIGVLMTPFIVVLVIWYIVSTPTADWVKEEEDEGDHYLCKSGGLVPGLTWVFFFILVGYGAFILVLSAIFVFVTRSVKTKYNESQVIALSIYNLVFVGMVSIPVLFVLRLQDAMVAYWILLICVIMYTFTSTMFFQFAPIVIGQIKDVIFPPQNDHDKTVRTKPDAEG